VFEGLDGAGTTTQIELLGRALRDRGHAVEVTHEPTDGPFGAVLRQAVEGRLRLDARTLAAGFAADRSDHLRNEVNGIEQALARGSWVLCDRYLLSSLAYQHGQGLALDEILDLNRPVRVPDLTLFFQADPETCVARIGARSDHDELFHALDTLRGVAESYLAAIDCVAEWMSVKTVSAEGSIDEVHQRVLDLVMP
jgi:dTMP kinase